ncbi:MAG: Unknown protein [uncultured Aureispira sp.]|uniref:DUF4272 domain-containing protein n=1 Tax=uncultured Aureispira sp. TaxID=1331704 RepID=A0A6S6S9M8_9BACT|nr:MAG: Unknown protein [uncultured Aureispira sp.]
METCTIYSHYIDFEAIEPIVKKYLPKASLKRQDLNGEKILLITYKKGFLGRKHKATIKGRQRRKPSYQLDQVECPLCQNLMGMQNYVTSLPAQDKGIQSLLLEKIATLNSETSFSVQPYVSEDFEKILKAILQHLDGILFTPSSTLFSKSKHQQFLDKDFGLILDSIGVSELSQLEVVIDAKYYDQAKVEYTAAQKKRKAKSEAVLEKHQVKINAKLPCTADLAQLDLRDQDAILDRIYALSVITAKAEGITISELEAIIADKEITAFSPYESHVLSNDVTAEELSVLTWRYESLFLLCWVINKIDVLPYPSEMCAVETFVPSILEQSRAEFSATITLRTKEEIADALDLIYRMNWACVDARIKREATSGKLHPGIVYERHYTLNWLTNHRQQAWDDVTTDT